MILTVIGLSTLMVTRVQARGSKGEQDFGQARLIARSAIEVGLFHLATDPDWRTTFSSGVWIATQSLGDGTYSLSGRDPLDNYLPDDESDPLVLEGTANVGQARYVLEVSLSAKVPPLTCLEVAWHAGEDIVIDAAAVIACDQIISANDVVETTGVADINADVEAVNAITGSVYNQATTTGIEPRSMPDPISVFDHYIANGTAISIAAIPQDSGIRVIQRQLITPATNPYGVANIDGIYVIDCMGAVLRIQDSRIIATLVILNPGPGSSVTSAINWAPAQADYPSLLVSGAFEFSHSASTPLDEAALGVNFNPPGSLVEGLLDLFLDDVYPTTIKGLVYVSGDIVTRSDPAFEGVVVSGGGSIQRSDLTLSYQSNYLANPPPGFTAPAVLSIDTGSWKQVVEN
jgi:hypothetical protein